jgi:predicted Zn-dependent peptidase
MKFFRRKLKNGMVVLMEKREVPVVSFSVTNRFGGAYEDSNIKGVAHFIEHLLFTGTKSRSHEDISREIEKKGGELNAFTSQELTSFHFKMPSIHFASGLAILTDMLNNSVFNLEKFEKERRVIIEEIKMYHDTPQRHVLEMLEGNLYDKPFGESITGSQESLKSLNRDFVFEFFKKNYGPSNYIVCIVGNADFDNICSYLESHFKGKKVSLKPKLIKLMNKNSVEERSGIDQAHLCLGMHAPLRNTKEFDALMVLDAYLADGMSSRLFLEIREKRGLAYNVRSMINSERDYSYYSIYVGTTKEKIDEVKKLIIEEFNKVEDMNEINLKEAKDRLMGLKAIHAEESSSVMNELIFHELVGKAEDYYDQDKRIKKVSLENVKKVARNLVKKYSSAEILPK